MRSLYAVERPLYPHSSTSEIRRGKGRRRSISKKAVKPRGILRLRQPVREPNGLTPLRVCDFFECMTSLSS